MLTPSAPYMSEATLEKTPGWLNTSVSPGEEGVCVVYGHLNRNHLQILKDVTYGETINVTMPNGTVYCSTNQFGYDIIIQHYT